MFKWVCGDDYILYPEPNQSGQIGECCHCKKKYTNTNSLIYQHPKYCTSMVKDNKKQLTLQSALKLNFSKEHKKSDKDLEKVVRFICENGVSINATQSQSFIDLVGFTFSEAEIRNGILTYANKIREEAQKKAKSKLVSLVIDGATIVKKAGWYAVGLATEKQLWLYDVYHFPNSTTLTISENLNNIINSIEESCKCRVVGASSDNAPNISNVFNIKHQDGLARRHQKYLIRSPCQAHTSNLVMKDLEKKDMEINIIFTKVRVLASFFHQKKLHSMIGIPTECPLVRETRWMTEYRALVWLVENRFEINEARRNLNDVIPDDLPDVQENWYDLKVALEPLAKFCHSVEADICPLYKSYQLHMYLCEELDRLSDTNAFAVKVREIVIDRWFRTADFTLMELAERTRYQNIISMREEVKELTAIVSIQRETGTSEQEKLTELTACFAWIEDRIIEYAAQLGKNFENHRNEIHLVLSHCEPATRSLAINLWQCCCSNGQQYFERLGDKYKYSKIDGKVCGEICFVLAVLQSLPSSEAFCERVFAHMRKLFNQFRENCKDDLIRAQTVIKMSMLWHTNAKKLL